MFELRMYGRRPSCIVRYRHGGIAALFPVVEQVSLDARAAVQGGHAVVVEPVETATVLHFPHASERSKRKLNARPKGRPKGRQS